MLITLSFNNIIWLTMLQSAISLCFVLLNLLTVSADSINSFHKATPTNKPDMLFEDSPASKPRRPSHISEFTDPDTGLNPFLDLEEGPTSAGRNVMKDERRKDPPFLDFELVEGDSTDRQWSSPDISKLPVEETIHRWPPFEDSIKEAQPTTTDRIIPEVFPTTEELYESSLDPYQEEGATIEEQTVNGDVRTSESHKDSIIYYSATIVTVSTLALVVGICWWRRKVKRTTHSPVAAENGELER